MSAETSITVQPAAPATSPPIDWRAEGERAARNSVDAAIQSNNQPFGEKVAPLRRDKRKTQFEWKPEPARVGFSGLLPYVRLGKRCVVGLGFFGCAIGELPQANGELFVAMRDPDLPQSSVPELDE